MLDLQGPELRKLFLSKSSPLDDVCFLIFLEPTEDDPSWGTAEKALNWLVTHAQPSPSLTHVEIVCPPQETPSSPRVHFATYCGQSSGWEYSFGDSYSFYLGSNASHWRAIPIAADRAAERIRNGADAFSESPYSIGSYIFSAPPGRFFSWLVPSSSKAPSHCASLAARVLSRILPEVSISHAPAFYGPSTLFSELTKPRRAQATCSKLGDETVLSLVESEELNKNQEVLLFGDNTSVGSLSHTECVGVVKRLAIKAAHTTAYGDSVAARIVQKQLAKALLRWSQVQHFSEEVSGEVKSTTSWQRIPKL